MPAARIEKSLLLSCVLVVCWGTPACKATPELTDPGHAELRRILTTNPERAAERAIAQGDKLFLGISGFGLELPGLTEAEATSVHLSGQYHAMRGTRDYNVSDALSADIKRARAYAARYNRRIKSKFPVAPYVGPPEVTPDTRPG